MPEGFFKSGDGVLRGKGVSSLRNSQDCRNAAVLLFGGIHNLPCSVMRAKLASVEDRKRDGVLKERGYDNTNRNYAKSLDKTLSKEVRRAYHVSGRGPSAGALSTFPQNVGRSILLFYSDPGQIVFDPFAGHNSRMDLTIKEGRHYVGCDLSHDFMKFNRQRAKVLRERFPSVSITLYEGDSRSVPVTNESADFTITSPPYYDIEYYGDEPEQLGKAGTYRGFLKGLLQVIRENFRVLKPGAFAVWFVNDFRRDGEMIFYHADVIRLGKKAGFVAHDLLVVDLGRTMRESFTNQVIKTRILPKRHEYGIVFRKPLENIR